MKQEKILEPSAVSVSVQGDAVIPVDEDGKAIHPAILGMDYRSLDEAEECSAIFGSEELFKRTGMRPHPINTLTKIMLLRRIAPEVYGKAAGFVTYSDFIMGKLGAPGFIDYTMAGRTMAFDIETGAWSLEILSRTGIPVEKLSLPVASGSVVGYMSKPLKTELGIER